MRYVVLAVVALAVGAAPAHAQSKPLCRVGISAGASLPYREIGRPVAEGAHLAGLLSLAESWHRLGLRAEGAYHRMTLDGTGKGFRVLAATLSGTFDVATAGGATPYIVGGTGLYHATYNGVTRPNTKIGVNAGAGVHFRVAAVRAFVEGRYHRIPETTDVVPLSVGVLF